jgi:hypothetical protein
MRQRSRVRAFLTKPIRGRAVRVVLALVLGAATTVAVAWTLALLVDGSFNTSPIASRGFSYEVAVGRIRLRPGGELRPIQDVRRAQRWGTSIVVVNGPYEDGQGYGSVEELLEGTSFAEEMKEKFICQEPASAWWRADGWPFTAFSAEASVRRRLERLPAF